jgi:hypothetical protein
MMTLPIDRLILACAQFLRGVRASEAGSCEYCDAAVAPFEGERSNGHVFCNEACALYDFERTA